MSLLCPRDLKGCIDDLCRGTLTCLFIDEPMVEICFVCGEIVAHNEECECRAVDEDDYDPFEAMDEEERAAGIEVETDAEIDPPAIYYRGEPTRIDGLSIADVPRTFLPSITYPNRRQEP